jgi:hypothetical protein
MPGSSKPIDEPPSAVETAPGSMLSPLRAGEIGGSSNLDFFEFFAVALSFGTLANDEQKPKFRAWTGHFLGIL